jgi:hypothetical protein
VAHHGKGLPPVRELQDRTESILKNKAYFTEGGKIEAKFFFSWMGDEPNLLSKLLVRHEGSCVVALYHEAKTNRRRSKKRYTKWMEKGRNSTRIFTHDS